MDDNAVRNEKKKLDRERRCRVGAEKKMKKMKNLETSQKVSSKVSSKSHPLLSQNVTNFFEGGVEVDVKVGAELMSKMVSKLMSF